MDESQAFRNWLSKNQKSLRRYAPDEIVHLARLNGFSIAVACEHTADHITQLKRLLEFWESPLSDQWMRLSEYVAGIDEDAA